MRLLLIEDSPTLRDSLREWLAAEDGDKDAQAS